MITARRETLQYIARFIVIICTFCAASSRAAEAEFDWNRAKDLHQRAGKGETLSADDQTYYDRARKLVSEGKAPWQKGGNAANANIPGNKQTGQPIGKSPTGLIPLSELGTAQYKGEDGGLYGAGSNDPPAEHAAAAAKEISKLQPLDAEGKPSLTGKIVLLGVGMSNTTMEFSRFKDLADKDTGKAKNLVIVDGAQGGKAAKQWSVEAVYDVVQQRLKSAGVTPQQVQVAWIKQANMNPTGELQDHAKVLENDMGVLVRLLKKHYPNLRVAYLSSRIYGGYATSRLNPEPYAYEGAFAMRWLIQAQIKKDAQLNYDETRGAVVAPLLLWGPYLWADGTTPRKSDALIWEARDFAADGTHPADSARQKVAEMLLKFCKTDASARSWFVGK